MMDTGCIVSQFVCGLLLSEMNRLLSEMNRNGVSKQRTEHQIRLSFLPRM